MSRDDAPPSRGTIVYTGGFELPDKNAAAHRVLGVAKTLRAIGYEVVLNGVSNEASSAADASGRDIQGFETRSVAYPRSGSQWARYLCSIESFVATVERYEDVSAVICYNYPAVALYRIMSYCRRRQIKCICDCTEWYSVPKGASLHTIAKAADTFVRMRVLQKKADGVVCISSYLERYYSPHTTTVRIPPLIDLDDEKWCAAPKAGAVADKVFAYAGSPGTSKDRLDVVIQSLAALEDSLRYQFKVIGLSESEYLRYHPEHQGLLDALGGRVNFLGRLSHIDSLAHLKSADFVIFVRENSRANNAGFPTKFVESTACGTHVITTRCSDLDAYLDDESNGCFVDHDASDLPGLLRRLIRAELVLDESVDPRLFDYRAHVGVLSAFLDTAKSPGEQ